jgi:hypothetical protein
MYLRQRSGTKTNSKKFLTSDHREIRRKSSRQRSSVKELGHQMDIFLEGQYFLPVPCGGGLNFLGPPCEREFLFLKFIEKI